MFHRSFSIPHKLKQSEKSTQQITDTMENKTFFIKLRVYDHCTNNLSGSVYKRSNFLFQQCSTVGLTFEIRASCCNDAN